MSRVHRLINICSYSHLPDRPPSNNYTDPTMLKLYGQVALLIDIALHRGQTGSQDGGQNVPDLAKNGQNYHIFSVDSVLLVIESRMTTQNVGNSRIMGCVFR